MKPGQPKPQRMSPSEVAAAIRAALESAAGEIATHVNYDRGNLEDAAYAHAVSIVLNTERGEVMAETVDLAALQRLVRDWKARAEDEGRERMPGWVGAQSALIVCADELAAILPAVQETP